MKSSAKPSADQLREQHPSINFQSLSWETVDDSLVLTFNYILEPDISFRHQVSIAGVTPEQLDKIPQDELKTYVFNIGMVELLSYWKLASPEEIVVDAASLSLSQVDWWHRLLIKGMGEYFFVNQIDFTKLNFVNIRAQEAQDITYSSPRSDSNPVQSPSNGKILVPLGGGKDSALTLTLLKEKQLGALLINPTQAARDIAEASGLSPAQMHRVDRQFDPQLFALNDAGYLNGHVPVSASFAFISLLVGRLFGYQFVAISNERSSNEGNATYLGHTINHQYSKTYEFERSFQEYVSENLPPQTPFYFSLLRPLYELQIARLFAERCSDYFSIFRSCNRGQRTNSWCGECAKCLFAYAILFPWLGEEKLVEIFGKNLFEDESLLPTALEMLGLAEQKPFECVGTHQETRVAFGLSTQNYLDLDKSPPALLEKLSDQHGVLPLSLSDSQAKVLLDSVDAYHSIPDQFSKILISIGKY